MLPAALIFDVDGTLAETEEAHREAFNDSFSEAGREWRWDVPTYTRLLDVTGGKERIRHFATTVGEAIDDDAVAALHRRKTELYVARASALALRPGVARLIGEARAAGVTLAIATTTSPANVDELLRATLGADSPGWFAAIGAGDVVAAKKPAPDLYLWVLERLGLEAARCVAFEDSANGLAAALGAGVATVVTVGRYTAHQTFPGALAVLDGLGEPDAPARRLDRHGGDSVCVTLETTRRWVGDPDLGSAD